MPSAIASRPSCGSHSTASSFVGRTAPGWLEVTTVSIREGSATLSVRHRVQQNVHAELVPRRGKLHEEIVIFTFSLPGIADVGVVRHHDHDAPPLIRDHSE